MMKEVKNNVDEKMEGVHYIIYMFIAIAVYQIHNNTNQTFV